MPSELAGPIDVPAPAARPVQPVRKAYEQVYDQLRELILDGRLKRGERLPNELVLARDFRVSRGTVREALRVLTSEGLVRTAKGAGGGTFVTRPTADHISELLEANIGLLGEAQEISPLDFIEVRELLEVFAASRAARRHTPADLERLRALIMPEPSRLSIEHQFHNNSTFHSALLGAAHNELLSIAAEPVFSILRGRLRRTRFPAHMPTEVNHDHETILAAIVAGDADGAAQAMREHMGYLRGVYQRAGVWIPDTGEES